MITEGALLEEDFVGFNIRNKDTVHGLVSMSENTNPSKPECEVIQKDLKEWGGADKGIVVSGIIAD